MARIKIQRGQTLSGIAKQYKTTIPDLMKVNPQIKNPNLIYAGSNLNLPGQKASQTIASQTIKPPPAQTQPQIQPQIQPQQLPPQNQQTQPQPYQIPQNIQPFKVTPTIPTGDVMFGGKDVMFSSLTPEQQNQWLSQGYGNTAQNNFGRNPNYYYNYGGVNTPITSQQLQQSGFDLNAIKEGQLRGPVGGGLPNIPFQNQPQQGKFNIQSNQTPQLPPQTTSDYEKQLEQAQGYQSPSPTEVATQQKLDDVLKQLDTLNASKELGLANVESQPVAMPFITGQQAALERQVSAQAQALQSQAVPLQRQLAQLQAERQARQQAAIDVARTGYEYAQQREAQRLKEQEAAKPFDVGGQAFQFNPQIGKYIQVPGSVDLKQQSEAQKQITQLTNLGQTSIPQDLWTKAGYSGSPPDTISTIQQQRLEQQAQQSQTNEALRLLALQQRGTGVGQNITLNIPGFGQQTVRGIRKPSTGSGGSGSISAQTSYSPNPDGTLDPFVQKFLTDGSYPPFAFGKVGQQDRDNFKAAVKAAAQSQGISGSDIALQKAEFSADKSALTAVDRQAGLSSASEKTAQKNLDLATKLGRKVDRTGSPIFNKVLLKAKGQYAGDADTLAFETAIKTATNEYAKVITGQTGGAAVSDAARRETDNLLNATYNQQAFDSVVATMRKEMSNRVSSFSEQQSEIKSRMHGSQPITSVKEAKDKYGLNY